jgi:hypothetical protein
MSAGFTLSVAARRAGQYGEEVRVERHWWNGDRSAGGRRDVYIRSDGQRWEVEAQAGGGTGRSKVQQCPGQASAEILAGAWRGGSPGWREMPRDRDRFPAPQEADS